MKLTRDRGEAGDREGQARPRRKRLALGRRPFRNLLLGAILLGAVVLAVTVALPIVASTHLVRDRIASQMGIWSGYHVVVGDGPQVEVWPRFRAVLEDVRFLPREDRMAEAVIEAARIEIDLSALAALRGRASFDRVRLIDPLLRVSPQPGAIALPILPEGGKMKRAVDAARDARRRSPVQPDTASLPDDGLGVFEVVGGRIIARDDGGEREIASQIEGRLDWPQLNRPANLSGRGTWRGQVVNVEVASSQPLLHAAGASAGLTLSLRAPDIALRFEGSAGAARDALVEGGLQLSAPSLLAALTWLRPDQASQAPVGPGEFTGQLSGTRERLRFGNAALSVETVSGIGSLEVDTSDAVAAISGTMAFDMIDLRMLSRALTPFIPAFDAGNEAAPDFNLDLRLSASRAILGPMVLAEMAATAQVRPGLAVFDISDASVFGGLVQIGLRADRGGEAERVEFRLDARDIDGAAAGAALGLPRLLPAARGSVSILASGTGSQLNALLASAKGSVSARFGAGTLSGPDINRFTARLNESGFFSLGEIAPGTLAIEEASIEATLGGGAARLTQATIRAGERSIRLQGIVPFGGGLALTGEIGPPDPADPAAAPARAPARFFVGGSWQAPFIAPVPAASEPPG